METIANDELKQVILQLIQEFIQEEKGNTVTNNNMSGLLMKLNAAADGLIRIKAPDDNTQIIEPDNMGIEL